MPAAKKAQQYSAHELADRLAKKYAAPQYAFLEQVRNGTGGFANRSADAMALSLWPSRGLMLDGFEIKGYRTDWLRELKNPAKAEELAVYCNRWWIVARRTSSSSRRSRTTGDGSRRTVPGSRL